MVRVIHSCPTCGNTSLIRRIDANQRMLKHVQTAEKTFQQSSSIFKQVEKVASTYRDVVPKNTKSSMRRVDEKSALMLRSGSRA